MKLQYVEPEFVGRSKRHREMIEKWEARKAKEPLKVRRTYPEDVRAMPEPLAKAIKRNIKRGR